MERDHSGGVEEKDDREQMARKLRQGLSQRIANRSASLVSPLRDSPSVLVRLAQLGAFDEFHRHFAGLGVTPARFAVFALRTRTPAGRGARQASQA
jgi:hypothetical protein